MASNSAPCTGVSKLRYIRLFVKKLPNIRFCASVTRCLGMRITSRDRKVTWDDASFLTNTSIVDNETKMYTLEVVNYTYVCVCVCVKTIFSVPLSL